jgi:hypothetical protein
MHNQIRILKVFVSVLVMVYFMGGQAVFAAESARGNDRSAADVMIGADGIYFVPKVGYGHLVITVSTPNGSVFKKSFDPGGTPFLGLSEVCGNQSSQAIDGSYTYELRVSPAVKNKVRAEAEDSEPKADMKTPEAVTQTGYFTVRGGSIVIPSNRPEPNRQGISRPEYTYDEDVYVVGSLCVGTDCADPETWGYDVIRLKENNLRLHFDDTSSTSAFPANDWRILINDTADGGANYFAVEDTTSGDVPFKIEAGAPDNSLYIEDYGRIGLKTSTPAVELHIVDGDSPCTRLEQDTSSGWTAQVWDVVGNESNFFIRDVTNSSKLPFRIQPGTPSSTLCLKSDGKIGIGTWSPAYPMELDTTGQNAAFTLKRTDGATNFVNATASYAQFGAVTNHPVRILVNSAWKMMLNTDGSLSMSNGATCTAGGVWTNSSSRALKENIQALDTEEALDALTHLSPVKFNYKVDKGEKHVGFIAEDAPELVATKGRKGMSPMDVVAVLTKVVQEQQKTLLAQQKVLQEQQKTISELKEKINRLVENK